MKYLLDTNILIYLEKGISDPNVADFLSEATAEGALISIMTEIELLGFKFPSPAELRKMEDLIADTTVLQLDRAVALQTIAIRRNHKIKTPDAIIAATAIAHELTERRPGRVTRNMSDFSSISSLSVINPFDV